MLQPLRQHVEAIIGRVLEIPRLQTGGPKLSADDLSPAARRRIEDFYAEDYEAFGAFF